MLTRYSVISLIALILTSTAVQAAIEIDPSTYHARRQAEKKARAQAPAVVSVPVQVKADAPPAASQQPEEITATDLEIISNTALTNSTASDVE